MNAVQKAFHKGRDYENCYIFSPSVSRRKSVGSQTYYVRRYSTAARTLKIRWRSLQQIKSKKS